MQHGDMSSLLVQKDYLFLERLFSPLHPQGRRVRRIAAASWHKCPPLAVYKSGLGRSSMCRTSLCALGGGKSCQLLFPTGRAGRAAEHSPVNLQYISWIWCFLCHWCPQVCLQDEKKGTETVSLLLLSPFVSTNHLLQKMQLLERKPL